MITRGAWGWVYIVKGRYRGNFGQYEDDVTPFCERTQKSTADRALIDVEGEYREIKYENCRVATPLEAHALNREVRVRAAW